MAFHRTSRRSFRRPPYTSHEQRALRRVIRCQKVAKSGPIIRRHLGRYKRGYRRRFHWQILQTNLPPATEAMLARLRGCETRGIPYPANYRHKGHHRGAYQYTLSTWARAGGHGDPADASPAEQDVRTARFFPAHRGEWSCPA